MQHEVCSLIVDLKLYGFLNYSIPYPFMRDTISKIDDFTYHFRDQKTFFNEHYVEILEKVKMQQLRSSFLVPSDIELGDNGIFVKKPQKKVTALFKYVGSLEQQVPLEELLAKKCFEGSLGVLYKCDRKRSDETLYESLFDSSFDINALSRHTVMSFINSIKDKKRFYETVRFLLMSMKDESFDSIYASFLETVSAKEPINNNFGEPEKKYYRSPYNDN